MKKIVLIIFLGFLTIGMAQDVYTLSSESKLTIDGSSTVHEWTVTANTMTGSIRAQDTALKQIDFEVVVADIISERGAAMDKKMHAALKKEAHPKIMFSLQEVKNASVLVGMLTIAGTEKSVEIDSEIIAEGNTLKLKGEKEIILQDFGMTPPTAMFGAIIVGDAVIVKFDLTFVKD